MAMLLSLRITSRLVRFEAPALFSPRTQALRSSSRRRSRPRPAASRPAVRRPWPCRTPRRSTPKRARPERIVFALGHARKTADAVQLPFGFKRLAASRDDLVGVGLMADVPDDPVLRGVEDVMQGRSQFHGPEARCQVARIDRTLVDDVTPQLVAVGGQFLRREFFNSRGEEIVSSSLYSSDDIRIAKIEKERTPPKPNRARPGKTLRPVKVSLRHQR